eukprot:gene16294-9112_t
MGDAADGPGDAKKKRYDDSKTEKTPQQLVDAHPGHNLTVKDATHVTCGTCSVDIDVAKNGVKKVKAHCLGFVIEADKTASVAQKVEKLKPAEYYECTD